jgi:hypothetical protein
MNPFASLPIAWSTSEMAPAGAKSAGNALTTSASGGMIV